MNIDTKLYELKLEEFKQYHPYLKDHVAHVRPRGEGGIRVTLDDGTQYDYCNSRSGIRRVVEWDPKSIDEITDEGCRKSIAYHIVDLMNNRGFSQNTLAERAKIAKGSINKYLNQTATPSATALRKIAHVLGCTVDELID